MEIISNNFMPGDPRLVQQLVNELKSQGIFDQFRKECFADVDTKPAYQNLRQRVEGSVAAFLKEQTWSPDMNKNQVREQLKKNIHESGYLETGVERIVDQVVNPKINTVFLPIVEDVVYKYLGIEKPQRDTQIEQKNNVTDLLPKDLEAVSPESVQSPKHYDLKEDNDTLNDSLNSKMDEDESPPFEPLESSKQTVLLQDEISVDSELSGISGLQSHESNLASESKSSQMDWSWQDTQLSHNSSESKISLVPSEEPKMEINKDFTFLKSVDSDSRMGSSTKVEEDTDKTEDSVESMVIEDESTVDSQKQSKDKNEKNETTIPELKLKSNREDDLTKNKDIKIVDKKKGDEKKSRSSHKHSSKDDKRKSSSSRDKDRSTSRHSSSSKERDTKQNPPKEKDDSRTPKEKDSKISKDKVEKDRDEKDKMKDKYNKTKENGDEKSNKEKHGGKNKSKSKKESYKDKDQDKSKFDKDKSGKDLIDKQKDNNDKEKIDKEKFRNKDKLEKEKSDKLKDKTEKSREKSDKSDKKDKERTKNSSTNEKNSSGSNVKKESSSSSTSKNKSSDKNSKASDKHKKEKHRDKSSETNRDKKRESKKDDHYSSKEKKNHRRSFDRDSNDGQSGKSSNCNASESKTSSSQQSSKSNSYSFGGSGDSGNFDAKEISSEKSEVMAVQCESPPVIEVPKMKYIKPKFALNFEEAKRIMKIRKQLAILEKQNQLSLADLTTVHNGFGQTNHEKDNDTEHEQVLDDVDTPKTSPFRGFDKESEKTPSDTKGDSKQKMTYADLNLQSIFLSKEKWEALEARLEQEMLKINFNAYESHYDDYDDADCSTVTISPMKNTSVRNTCVIEEFKPRRILKEEHGEKEFLEGFLDVEEVNVEVVEEDVHIEHMNEIDVQKEEIVEEIVEMHEYVDEMNIIELHENMYMDTEIANNHHLTLKKQLSINLKDIRTKFNQDHFDSSDNCTHFDKPNNSEQRKLEYLNKLIAKLESQLKYSIKEYQNNILPEESVMVKKRGRKRKIDENVDVKNNNKVLNYKKTTGSGKRGRPSTAKITFKPSEDKSCNSTDIPLNDSFSLPLSPAESEQSIDRKEECVTPLKQRRTKSNTPRVQSYSSDELYKPRPTLVSTRRSRREKNP